MEYEGPGMNRRVPPLPSSAPSLPSPTRGSAPSDPARRLGGAVPCFPVGDEGARTRLISDISSLLHEPAIPDSARSAGLELISWLARRMPGEAPHALGVEEALRAKRAARRKPR